MEISLQLAKMVRSTYSTCNLIHTYMYMCTCTCTLYVTHFLKPFMQLKLHIIHDHRYTCMCEYLEQNSLTAIIFVFILCCYLSSLVGESISIECRMTWVQIPPEAAHFSQKLTVLGCVLCGILLFYRVSIECDVHVQCTCTMYNVHVQCTMYMTTGGGVSASVVE